MLSGCPDCGGTKFQFRPQADDAGSAAPDDGAAGSADPPSDDAPQVTGREWPMYGDEPTDERRARGRVGSRARGAPAGESDEPPTTADPQTTDDGIVVADEEPVSRDDGEDSAQADARTGVAAPDEVAQGSAADEDAADDPEAAPAPASDDGDDTPDLSALRKELNDQFESIRIVSPGQYELNLMELYEREEHIISLREDGRYVIEVPETWRSG